MQVLIAEDDPVSCRLLESYLTKWAYMAIVTHDGEEAWEVLQREDPRLAILDWVMPRMDGPQVCRRLRSSTNPHYVYVILLTAKSQKEDLIAGLEAGADEYLIKPNDRNELRARLRAGARIIELQQQLLSAQEALRVQATHDSPTGAFNRAAIFEILQRELARCEREGGSMVLALVDIDHFKSINDKLGHQAGDAVLREVIQRLGATVRPYDSIGRYGGEEFLVVVRECDGSPLALAERLRQSIADQPFQTDAGAIRVTVSLGVATSDGQTLLDALIRLADEALYRAKNHGRNRVEVVESGILRSALCQPRVKLGTEQTFGVKEI